MLVRSSSFVSLIGLSLVILLCAASLTSSEDTPSNNNSLAKERAISNYVSSSTEKSISSSGNGSGHKDRGLQLTKEEKRKLDELYRRVKPVSNSWDQVFLQDRFLVKWLQARDFDVNRAEDMFRQTVEWRQTNRIGSILNEDMSKWEKSYPFLIDGVDWDGHPLYVIPAGRYDIRNAIISGQGDQLLRYFEKQLEFGVHHGNNLTITSGRNLDAKGVIILDMIGFNLRQQGCLGCLPLYVRGLFMYEANFPRIVDKLFVINSPALVPEIFDVIKYAMSEDSRNLIEIYGFDKSQWSAELLKRIPADQLPIRYGGTKKVSTDTATAIGGKNRV